MRNFIKDQRGNVIGLVVMIVTVFAVAIMWIVSMPAVTKVWEAVYPGAYPAYAAGTMNMLNNVTGWTLLVLIIGTLVYAAALMLRRDPYDIPA